MQRLVSFTPLPATKELFPSHRFKVQHTHFLPFQLILKNYPYENKNVRSINQVFLERKAPSEPLLKLEAKLKVTKNWASCPVKNSKWSMKRHYMYSNKRRSANLGIYKLTPHLCYSAWYKKISKPYHLRNKTSTNSWVLKFLKLVGFVHDLCCYVLSLEYKRNY